MHREMHRIEQREQSEVQDVEQPISNRVGLGDPDVGEVKGG